MHVLRACRIVLLAVLVVAAALARAADTRLYEAVVPVQDQGPSERVKATGDGLRQVVVKLAGQRSVLDLPAVQAEVARADTLLASYRYETFSPRVPGQPVDPTLDGPLRLHLMFDAGGVGALLNRAGAPVWGPNRPKTYLWVLREGAVGRSPVTLGMTQADVLLDAAVQRGIPVVVPGPEPLGMPLLTSPDPAAGLPADVGDAAERNGARIAVAAVVGGPAGRVHALGTVRIEGDTSRIDLTAADESSALRELVAAVADRLGARYAVVARQDQFRAVRLRVAGVADIEALAALERALSAVPLAKDIVIDRVADDRVEFVVMVAGEPAQFVQSLQADSRFASVGAPVAERAGAVVEATLR